MSEAELPEAAEDPLFFSLETSTWIPMANIVISGDLPEVRMKDLAEELQDEVESSSHIDTVRLSGLRDRQVWVEIDPDKRRRGL